MADPKVGSVWEIRYRVKGRSAVWPNMFVCDIISGPDKGEYVVLNEEHFNGEKSMGYRQALVPARKRKSDG